MLYSYHHLFKLDQEINSHLNTFSQHYNHVYHRAYQTVAIQNQHQFQSHLISLGLDKLSNKKLIQLYKNKPFNLSSFNFELSSDNKKLFLTQQQITGRQLNSITHQLTGNLKSLYELSLNNIESKKNKISSLQEKLNKEKNKFALQLKLFHYTKDDIKELNKTYFYYRTYLNNNNNKSNESSIKLEIKLDKKSKGNSKKVKTKKIKYKKFEYPNKQHKLLVKHKHTIITLSRQLNKLTNSLDKLILNQIKGQLPLCFGTKKLFHKQYNLKHYYKGYIKSEDKEKDKENNKDKDNHEFYFNKWKEEFTATRNKAFYLMGCKNETSGNNSCQSILNSKGKIDIKLRLLDKMIPDNAKLQDKYITINNLHFGKYHKNLINALNNNQAIHYRFERNIDKKNTKYNTWTITFQVDTQNTQITTNKKNGAIGIDLNQEHLAVTEIDGKGNLIKSFNIPLKLNYIDNQYTNEESQDRNNNLHHNRLGQLSSHQSAHLLGNVMVELCEYARQVNKPIVIEKLDFKYKKETLSNSTNKNNLFHKKRNKQLSSFIYSKFASLLPSRCAKDGVECIEVNPAYTSVLGKAKYQKAKGLSVHQAAAYCIARRGLGYRERVETISLEENNQLEINYKNLVKEYQRDIKKINKQSKNKYKISNIELRLLKEAVYKDYAKEIVLKGHVVKYILPVRKTYTHKYNMTILKDLSKEMKEVYTNFVGSGKLKVKPTISSKWIAGVLENTE